jgi:ABC-type phosphate/phosphonate transport system, periplasmic component
MRKLLLLMLLSYGASADDLLLSAPPKLNAAESEKMYGPIAAYLSKALGRKVVYEHGDNFLTYGDRMTRGRYDLVIDGPHFAGWKIEKLGYTPAVMDPAPSIFVTVVSAKSDIKTFLEVRGQTVCAHSPPNLGTLTMLNDLDTAIRLPFIVTTSGFDAAYKRMVKGDCKATIMPKDTFEKMNAASHAGIVIREHKPWPSVQVVTCAKGVDCAQVARVLLTPEGQKVTTALREKNGSGGQWIDASKVDLRKAAAMLHDELGFKVAVQP